MLSTKLGDIWIATALSISLQRMNGAVVALR